MKSRVVTIGLAVLLAVVGTVSVLLYVRSADTRAVAGMRPVTVLVVANRVTAGTTARGAVDTGLLHSEQLPAQSVPADAVSQIGDDMANLVATADIQPGQLVLREMFAPHQPVPVGLPVPAGQVAISLPLCVPEAVAGYVRPGSNIAIFDTIVTSPGSNELPDASVCGGTHTARQVATSTRLVLPKVQVLAVGNAPTGSTSANQSSTSSGSGGSGGSTVLLTLAVGQDDAERVVQLAETGLPYAALVTDDSKLTARAPAVPLI